MALATKRPNERGDENRRLVPDELRALLRGKCDNPMLGIYGGHLLLMETSVDVALLHEVVGIFARCSAPRIPTSRHWRCAPTSSHAAHRSNIHRCFAGAGR